MIFTHLEHRTWVRQWTLTLQKPAGVAGEGEPDRLREPGKDSRRDVTSSPPACLRCTSGTETTGAAMDTILLLGVLVICVAGAVALAEGALRAILRLAFSRR